MTLNLYVDFQATQKISLCTYNSGAKGNDDLYSACLGRPWYRKLRVMQDAVQQRRAAMWRFTKMIWQLIL